ncbi:DNA-processing protein DprA [Candidatus Saccharibacteria bacterium]|nr:DNA-processing protein DprA [Candidatus Saccharibacteria bacterium]
MGRLPNQTKAVSIVGARRSTPYGENIAYKLAYELAKRGVVVVSGLAYGIDACAHRGCLDAGGTTVAVLGTSIDKIYPQQNLGLAKRIIEHGAIVSEYPPGTETKNWHFLERNRIVSGLSNALIVVEAATRSGTHQTANDALEQNKVVYAVPGDIFRPSSVGCNKLIYDGAHPITSIDDFLLDYLGASSQKEFRYDLVISDMADSAKQIVAALKDGLTTADEIMSKYHIDIAELNRQTVLLQLRGIIQPCGPSSWILK